MSGRCLTRHLAMGTVKGWRRGSKVCRKVLLLRSVMMFVTATLIWVMFGEVQIACCDLSVLLLYTCWDSCC